jgi:mRNA-degrading endonuclease toxin of MazEF toxin-antitoxin module
VPDLRFGRIVRVELLDPQGRNPKVRPAVILTPTHEIVPTGDVQVVAITGEVGAAPAAECVALPWLATGHPKTGLSKPSVAVVTWLATVPVRDIRSARGLVPAPQLLDITRRIVRRAGAAAMPPPPNPSPPPPPTTPPPPSGAP